MDAKPQRIRVRGDENVPPSLQNNKAIHQRNKSMSALNATQDTKTGTRRAFGDVSNTKKLSQGSRDDSTVLKKPITEVSGEPVLSQPAQRPASMSGLKNLLTNVTAKPINPAGKAQTSKTIKRSNAVFRDQLEPVAEKETSKENATAHPNRQTNPKTEVRVSSKETKEISKKETSALPVPEEKTDHDDYVVVESDAIHSEPEELNTVASLKQTTTTNLASEPDEYWEDEVSHDASASRMDNTTCSTTAIIYPMFSSNTKGQILQAKRIVDASRTPEEIEEEAWDPSMVAEYDAEIFLHLRQKEVAMIPVHDYMNNQAEIQWSMRAVLMDWLVQVHFRFSLLPETLYLCVNYIDRFLSHKIVSLGKLQLVGATALFIAAKYEEITAPSVQEIVYMVDGGYTVDEILKAERFMLAILNYDLGWPGPMSFLRRISKADDYDLDTRTVAKYFIELTIMDERFVSTLPSYAAAGAHCLARMMLRKGVWSPSHAFWSGYLYVQLLPLMRTMLDCCQNPQTHHQAIYEKYLDRRFKRASLFVEGEMQRGFKLDASASWRDPGRLEGLAHY
ncbi:hypothetical protein N7488_011639 [Penicillium malachiteum]|nr:hypothetical protein N7488_011639 [Penicillium malachiteum]